MREAQRKYRFKKDATISVLQQRNAELESTLVAMGSTIAKLQDQIALLQQVEHKAEAMASLRTTAERLQADVTKAQRQPGSALCVDGRSDFHHDYRVHSTLWQTTLGEQISSRPVSALGYEVLNE
jgi:prefoldin subunit 5